MHSSAFLVLLLAVSVAGQNLGCPSGSGGQGPCSAALGITCPAGQFCIGDTTCCTMAELQPSTAVPPLPVVPTTPSSSCVDLVNPRTGISDCPNVSYLCNNAVYFQLMTQQCPRTCGRCSGTGTPTTTCVDRTNPNTGRSDCPNIAYLCNNPVYFQLMTQQCPATCGRCSGKK